MEILASQAAKQVGETFPFEGEETLEPLDYGGRTILFSAPLHVTGSFSFDGKAYTVEARADTVLSSACARCNRLFDEPYGFSLSERFVREGAAVDGETYAYTGERIDLEQALMDNLFLHLPIVSLCRADCRGLCPICGIDRNTQECACDTAAAENPFSKLSPLKEELKEV